LPIFFILLFNLNIDLSANDNNFAINLNNIMNGIQNHREPIAKNRFDEVNCPFILEVDAPAPQIEIEQRGNCKKFDIQFATKDQLMEIDGIDRRLARIIVGYRTNFGIKNINDLKNISELSDINYKSIINRVRESEECFKKLDEEIIIEEGEKQTKLKNSVAKKQIFIEPVLEMIFDDQVKIADHWYKIGDELGEFKIIKIEPYSIKLKSKKGDVREITISQTGNIQIESFVKQKK